MTKKDFTLIADSINASIERLLGNGQSLRVKLDKLDPYISGQVEDWMRMSLATEFATRLRYTADDFKEEVFKGNVQPLTKTVKRS